MNPVCEQIKRRCSELSIVNEQIADVLTKETSGPQLKSITGCESQSRAEGVCIKDTEPCATTKLVEGSDHSSRSNEEQDKEEQYFCPACEQSSMSGSIGCEEYGDWHHFMCVGLNDSSAEAIQTQIPFVCLYCNDNLMYNDPQSSQDVQSTNLIDLKENESSIHVPSNQNAEPTIRDTCRSENINSYISAVQAESTTNENSEVVIEPPRIGNSDIGETQIGPQIAIDSSQVRKAK